MTDIIFDASSVFARAWYVSTKDYTDINAVLRSGLQTVFSLLNRDAGRINVRVDRALFCWEGKNHGRDKGRSEKPSGYHETMDAFKAALETLIGAVHASSDVHEADDVVASAVEHSTADDVFIVSADKDLMQLQSDTVHYFCLNTKARLSRTFIVNKFYVKHPRQIAIAQAVIGDRADNIPGIKGWGLKKVKSLFESVTPEMSFSEALTAVERQIPDCHLDAFYSSLERTLLDLTIKGLPSPEPVQLISSSDVYAFGIGGIEDAYERMRTSYTMRRPARVAVGMEEHEY